MRSLVYSRVLALIGVVGAMVLTPAAAGAQTPGGGGPTIAVQPSSGLSDGDEVTVTGSGFSPAASVGIAMCMAAVTSGDSCDFASAQVATTDASGSFTRTFTVAASIAPPVGPIVCAPANCSIGAANLAASTETAAAPLSFAEAGGAAGDEPAADPVDAEDAGSDAAADESDETAAADDEDQDDNSSAVVPILVGVLVVALGLAAVIMRMRQTGRSGA